MLNYGLIDEFVEAPETFQCSYKSKKKRLFGKTYEKFDGRDKSWYWCNGKGGASLVFGHTEWSAQRNAFKFTEERTTLKAFTDGSLRTRKG